MELRIILRNFKHTFLFLIFSLSCQELLASNYIDLSLTNKEQINFELRKQENENQSSILQLFSHGRPGELFIHGKWMNAEQIVYFINSNFRNTSNRISHINFYGCEFGKGEIGKRAISYLQSKLGVSIAASDDITGRDGDWDLEIGTPYDVIAIPNAEFNLQLVGGMGPDDDFDGDGVLNKNDYDDDNDGIIDNPDELVLRHTPPSGYMRPIDKIATYNGGQPTLTQGQLDTITDVNSGSGYSNASMDNIKSIILNYERAYTVSSFRIYNYSPGHVGDSTFPYITYINSIFFYDIHGNIIYQTPRIFPSHTGAQGYYGVDFTSSPIEGVVKIIVSGIKGGTGKGVGLRDLFAPGLSYDLDKDGFPDKFDTDSDNDGCPDAAESNGGPYNNKGYKLTDLFGNWMINTTLYPIGTSGNVNGVPNSDRNNSVSAYDASTVSVECQFCNTASSQFMDYDGDGICNQNDLDNDNDGIVDSIECAGSTKYLFTPITYLNITHGKVLPDTDSDPYTGKPYLKINAGVDQSGNHIDVKISPRQSTNDASTTSIWDSTSNPIPGTIMHQNSAGNRTTTFTVEFFKTGTNQTVPIQISTIFTVRDIDGDGSWNNDNYQDSPNPPATAFAGNKVSDDYVFIGNGYVSSVSYNNPTLIYKQEKGEFQYIFSNGTDNGLGSNNPYSIVPGVSANESTMAAYLYVHKTSKFEINYQGGQFGGLYIDFTANTAPICDSDGDGIDDRLDTDSDGDGCPDAVEGANHISPTGSLSITGNKGSNQNLGTNVSSNGVSTVVGAPQGTTTAVTDSTINYCQLLPLELLNFNGQNFKCAINLKWDVAAEINMKSYMIERSNNGINFSKLATISPEGSYTDYNYTDENPYSGINYYRLKMTENDGNANYSKILNIYSKCEDKAVAIYPTLTDGSVFVSGLTLDNEVFIYNEQGQLMNTFSKEYGTLNIDISNYPAGMYFVKILELQNEIATTRIVKM